MNEQAWLVKQTVSKGNEERSLDGVGNQLCSAELLLIPTSVVEINLRLPSMLHGKKGFDRIVYACNNVLDTPVTWLFCDLCETSIHFRSMGCISSLLMV